MHGSDQLQLLCQPNKPKVVFTTHIAFFILQAPYLSQFSNLLLLILAWLYYPL